MAKYSKMIASKMGFDEDACQEVFYIGLMHDCGKLNIPDEILKVFTSIAGIDVGAKYHHERFDGNGYPSGLREQEIPQIARIIGVADAFDAMNSKRCYRDNLPTEVILRELKENREKQFDPECVDILLDLIDKGEIEIGANEE